MKPGVALPGYSGQLPLTDVSVQPASYVGIFVASAGNVTGSLPPGFTAPVRTSAVAGPPSWPGYHISTIERTLDAQGMSTGSPVLSTTIVLGLASATAEMSWSW